jgi:hypothetical protein
MLYDAIPKPIGIKTFSILGILIHFVDLPYWFEPEFSPIFDMGESDLVF